MVYFLSAGVVYFYSALDTGTPVSAADSFASAKEFAALAAGWERHEDSVYQIRLVFSPICVLVRFGVMWCCMETTLAKTDAIRRSISLPAEVAEKIDTIAATRHVTGNRAIVDLLSDAIAAYEQRRTTFLELADRFQKSTDPAETERLREELARMTFGS